MLLIFVGGNCVKRISGDALMDVPGGVVMEQPESVLGVPLRHLKLVDGSVVKIDPSPEEVDAAQAKATRTVIIEHLPSILADVENRLRVLEGKPPISLEQFLGGTRSL